MVKLFRYTILIVFLCCHFSFTPEVKKQYKMETNNFTLTITKDCSKRFKAFSITTKKFKSIPDTVYKEALSKHLKEDLVIIKIFINKSNKITDLKIVKKGLLDTYNQLCQETCVELLNYINSNNLTDLFFCENLEDYHNRTQLKFPLKFTTN